MMERFFGKRTDNVDLGDSERTFDIATFSKEQKNGLARLGYEYFYPLTRQTIADLRDSGNRFWTDWHKGDAFEQIASMGTEVALNPRALFLANSNGKDLTQQVSMIAKFSRALGKEVSGVKAVMGEAPDYSALAFAHKRATGSRLFGSEYDFDYARTKTPTSGSSVAIVGYFDGNGLRVSSLGRGDDHDDVWAVPLVVPQKAR